MAYPEILNNLHIYAISHVITYNNITNVVKTGGQSTVIIPDAKQFAFELEDIITNTQIKRKINT